ncbi:MAG TPA: hypothetical protein VIJ93_05500, partial [bacterium]
MFQRFKTQLRRLVQALLYLNFGRYIRKGRILYLFFLSILSFGVLLPRTAGALRPMSASIALVAGEETAGFRDGTFTSAFFKKPLGLAVSSDGTRLFLADSGNNRIRVIHLDQDNKVTTLAGQDSPGKQDGSLTFARFNQPHAVAYLPGELLVVNDFGNKLLRLVDLQKGTVSTLAGSAPTTLAEGPATQVSMAGIRDMVYLPAADSLFFSQPELGALKRLDLKTGQVALVSKNPGLPRPAALCASETKLYVADYELPQVFGLEWKAGTGSGLSPAATALTTVLSLTESGGTLYALQASLEAPLQRLLPQSEPVSFMSAAGDEIPQPGSNLFSFANSFYNMNPIATIGFVSDPLEARKLYIVNPYYNFVTSFRDLFGNHATNGYEGFIESS